MHLYFPHLQRQKIKILSHTLRTSRIGHERQSHGLMNHLNNACNGTEVKVAYPNEGSNKDRKLGRLVWIILNKLKCGRHSH